MRIAIACSGGLGMGIYRAVYASRHTVAAVLQNGRARPAAGRNLRTWWRAGPPSMLTEAARARVPVFWVDRMSECELEPLRALALDLLLVAGFSIILKEPLLGLPRVGCVNAHSSLLPRHRGPNPFSAVILSGDQESGVTFHVMEPTIDTGDILDQTAFPLTRAETMLTVYRKACKVAAARAVPVLDKIEAEGLHGTPQDPALATYDKRLTREEERIRWELPAIAIDRLVRALGPPGPAYFLYCGREIDVLATRYDETPSNAPAGTVISNRPNIVVATGAGRITLIDARTPKFGWNWPSRMRRPGVGTRLDAEP